MGARQFREGMHANVFRPIATSAEEMAHLLKNKPLSIFPYLYDTVLDQDPTAFMRSKPDGYRYAVSDFMGNTFAKMSVAAASIGGDAEAAIKYRRERAASLMQEIETMQRDSDGMKVRLC